MFDLRQKTSSRDEYALDWPLEASTLRMSRSIRSGERN